MWHWDNHEIKRCGYLLSGFVEYSNLLLLEQTPALNIRPLLWILFPTVNSKSLGSVSPPWVYFAITNPLLCNAYNFHICYGKVWCEYPSSSLALFVLFFFSGHGSKFPEPQENKAKVKSSAKSLYGEFIPLFKPHLTTLTTSVHLLSLPSITQEISTSSVFAVGGKSLPGHWLEDVAFTVALT